MIPSRQGCGMRKIKFVCRVLIRMKTKPAASTV